MGGSNLRLVKLKHDEVDHEKIKHGHDVKSNVHLVRSESIQATYAREYDEREPNIVYEAGQG